MAVQPNVEQREARLYVAIPIRVTRKEWGRANALIGEVFEWLGRNGVDAAGPPFVRFRVMGDMVREFDLEVGVFVGTPVPGDDRVISGSTPAGSYAVVVHAGHPDRLFEIDEELRSWVSGRELELASRAEGGERVWAGRFEVFLTDPDEEPDPRRWSTELAYLLADRP